MTRVNNRKPYYVMVPTPCGYNTEVETRYGRFFASIDSAVALANRVGGIVYEQGRTTRINACRAMLDGGEV